MLPAKMPILRLACVLFTALQPEYKLVSVFVGEHGMAAALLLTAFYSAAASPAEGECVRKSESRERECGVKSVSVGMPQCVL